MLHKLCHLDNSGKGTGDFWVSRHNCLQKKSGQISRHHPSWTTLNMLQWFEPHSLVTLKIPFSWKNDLIIKYGETEAMIY